MILLKTGRSVAGPGIVKVAVLGALGFLYAVWAIYGAGAEAVFLGFLLILAGIPVHVAIKWRNRASETAAMERPLREVQAARARLALRMAAWPARAVRLRARFPSAIPRGKRRLR